MGGDSGYHARNMKRYVVPLLALAFLCAGALAGGTGWQPDFTRAAKKAKKTGRPILVEFTQGEASRSLDKTVFHTGKFKSWARKNVVLLEVNSSRRLTKKLTAQHEELRKKYAIKEFPTLLLLDHEGKLLAKPARRAENVESWLKGTSELVAGASGAGKWTTDYEAARKTARRQRKPMLLDFNGSDW